MTHGLEKMIDNATSHETFLIDEGLELLASFNRILSRTLRDKVREMVNEIAKSYPLAEVDTD